jgi:hypothetical protein
MSSKYAFHGISEALKSHFHSSQIGFMFFELLNDSGYSSTEIKEVSKAMNDHSKHHNLLSR